MTSYAPNEMHYRYSSENGGRLIFSEVYYPVGWTLKLEETGEELPLVLEGKILRSTEVPAGNHNLVMSFNPPSYRIGKAVSKASSILIILLVLFSAGFAFLSNKRGEGDKVLDA